MDEVDEVVNFFAGDGPTLNERTRDRIRATIAELVKHPIPAEKVRELSRLWNEVER
jgi:hypothetical protein